MTDDGGDLPHQQTTDTDQAGKVLKQLFPR